MIASYVARTVVATRARLAGRECRAFSLASAAECWHLTSFTFICVHHLSSSRPRICSSNDAGTVAASLIGTPRQSCTMRLVRHDSHCRNGRVDPDSFKSTLLPQFNNSKNSVSGSSARQHEQTLPTTPRACIVLFNDDIACLTRAAVWSALPAAETLPGLQQRWPAALGSSRPLTSILLSALQSASSQETYSGALQIGKQSLSGRRLGTPRVRWPGY